MAKKSRTIVRDLGFFTVLKELSSLEGTFITVGIQGDEAAEKKKTSEGEEPSEASMALIASVHEFGRLDGSIPQRSFIRSTVDERRKQIADVQQKALARMVDGKISADDANKVVGQWVESAIKKKITDLKVPPNAPSTIAKKKSSNPLEDTLQMRSAITHAVVKGKRPRGQV